MDCFTFVRNDEAGENANAFARHKILQISYNDAAVSFVIARNERGERRGNL